MPFELELPLKLSQGQWKVKIREKETREPPHATIIKRTRAWRINLRTGEFMDDVPDPSEVPSDLINHIKSEETWRLLQEEWDKKYPGNPVSGENDE
jgi:hypothetical protein